MMPPVSPTKSGTLFPWLTQKLTTKFTKNKKKHEVLFLSVFPSVSSVTSVVKPSFWIATSLTLLAMTTGSAFAAINIPFTINLSENVVVTGTPRIAIDVGGNTRYATYTSGTGTNALTFTLSPTIGDVDLDGVAISSPIDLNGGTMKDTAGNDATLTFTPPNTSGIKINYPSLGMDFTNGATGRYTLNGTVYNDISSFLTASGGSFTRASIGTYFDSAGTLQTAANNTPRFDYDPVTHIAKGILTEGSRTNAAKYSEQLNNSAIWNYTAGLITVTPNTTETTAPDGTNNAEKITIDSTTPVTFTQANIAVTGTSATYSIYVKQGSTASNGFCLRNQTTATNLICGQLNYATNVFSYSVGTSGVSVQSIGNGWKRLIITATSGITSGDSLVAYVGFLGASYSIGQYLYAWGAQVETGSFATSYIPTTAAAVTRGEDSLTVPSGGWYNQVAGGFYNDIAWVSASGVNYPMFFRVDDTTTNNRWNLYYQQNSNALSIDAYSGGGAQGYFSSPSVGIAGTAKVAAAQSANNANAAFNGALKTLDTNWISPVITQLILKGGGANMWHKTVKYYPLRVSDTQLQLLTQ